MAIIKNRQFFYQKPSCDIRKIQPFLIGLVVLFLLPATLLAQQKHALLISTIPTMVVSV